MARPARLELATLCLEGRRSIQLSYGRRAYPNSKLFVAAASRILTRHSEPHRGHYPLALAT
jgi:hypothetical protein